MEEIRERIWYMFYYVRTEWGTLNLEDKEWLVEEIKGLMEDSTADNLWIVVMRFFNRYDQFLEKERIYLLSFIFETDIALLLLHHICISGIYYLKFFKIKKVLELFPKTLEKYRYEMIGLCLCVCDSKECYPYIKEVRENISSLSYETIICGLFSGVIQYDNKIEKLLMKRIEETDIKIINETTMDNPVFLVGLLYIWGHININELMEYEKYCDKSALLYFIIYPEYTTREMYCEQWHELLSGIRYRKYLSHIV